jgi:hypothetical protein
MNMKKIALASAVLLSAAFATSAFAQTADADKQAAVARYLRAVPMSKMMEDTYSQMAKQLPADKQAQFLSDMRSLVKAERIEQIASAAMVKTFTVEELNALADFYSSKNGASAMAKFGAYMGEVMPPLMQEVQRAVQEIQQRAQKCGLTLRSSGPPPAWQLARESVVLIIGLAGQAPTRWGPLSSNVRRHAPEIRRPAVHSGVPGSAGA